MDSRLQKRLMMFYLGGVINVFLGIYVLIEGVAFLPQKTAIWLVVFFLVFAAVDFWFPYALKRRWERELARRMADSDPGKKP